MRDGGSRASTRAPGRRGWVHGVRGGFRLSMSGLRGSQTSRQDGSQASVTPLGGSGNGPLGVVIEQVVWGVRQGWEQGVWDFILGVRGSQERRLSRGWTWSSSHFGAAHVRDKPLSDRMEKRRDLFH